MMVLGTWYVWLPFSSPDTSAPDTSAGVVTFTEAGSLHIMVVVYVYVYVYVYDDGGGVR